VRIATARVPNRRLAALPLATILLAALTGCGGGGGDDADDEAFVDLLPSYQYALTNPAGGPAVFTKTVIAPGQTTDVYSFDAGGGSVRGTVNLNTDTLSIGVVTTFTVNWSGGGPTPGNFAVGFTQSASQPSGSAFGLPTSGAYAVTWDGQTITVTFNGGTTIDVALNGAAAQAFTPSQFVALDVGGSAAPDWQRVAARSARALVDVLGRTRGIVAFLEDLNFGEFDSGQRVTTCATIPGSPPAGIAQTGQFVVNELSADDWRTTFTDCFAPFSSPAVGALTTGTLDLQNLVVTDDGSFVVSATLGGAVSDARLRGISESVPGVWSFNGNETRIDGGFRVAFTASP
jgi:hypothetical protein